MKLKLYQKKWTGFNSFQIKAIACFCMTIDHIGVYMGDNALIQEYYTLCRIIGRIAAPLFLFILIQSVRYTKSKFNLLKRLYLAGVLTGLSYTIFNALLGETVGIHSFGNIIFTYFYTAFYIVLIERTIPAIKEKRVDLCVKYAALAISSLFPCVVYRMIDRVIPKGIPVEQKFLIQGIRDSFLPALDHVDYGIGFVILGVVLYFLKKNTWQCLGYVIFCIACMYGFTVARCNSNIYIDSAFASLYFDWTQCWMILAAPFMMMYNKERGRSVKSFFYWYYPVHKYVIIILSTIYGVFL